MNFNQKSVQVFLNISPVLIFPMKIVAFRYVAVFLPLSIRYDDYRNPLTRRIRWRMGGTGTVPSFICTSHPEIHIKGKGIPQKN